MLEKQGMNDVKMTRVNVGAMVGNDDKSIVFLDTQGAALAAIQGLNQKLGEKEAEIQNLIETNDSLAQRLSELEAAVKSLAQKK
jgi:hypothetical protein